MKLTNEILENGGMLAWAESEAIRLSKLATFQPRGWTAVGYSRAYKGMMRQLRAVAWPHNDSVRMVSDIIDIARLKALAK